MNARHTAMAIGLVPPVTDLNGDLERPFEVDQCFVKATLILVNQTDISQIDTLRSPQTEFAGDLERCVQMNQRFRVVATVFMNETHLPVRPLLYMAVAQSTRHFARLFRHRKRLFHPARPTE
jgi:hypothetical protein